MLASKPHALQFLRLFISSKASHAKSRNVIRNGKIEALNMKTDVEYLEYLWPMRHYLITCGDLLAGTANIIAMSFCMQVSKEPPLIACAIG
jgi:hypothetical protein